MRSPAAAAPEAADISLDAYAIGAAARPLRVTREKMREAGA
jgi:hypothetical protein